MYSDLKVFGYPGHAIASSGPLRPPVHVRIKPINACNERCWFCAYRRDDMQLGEEMNAHDCIPAPKMAEIVEDCIAMGVRAVTFSGGGEPLIYPQIVETVRGLAAGGIRIGCLTNGVALRGAIADAFAEHATWVRVSIDAAGGAAYARSRGVAPSTFRRVIDNVSAFAARAARATIGFSFIVTRENAGDIRAFCALARDAGARHVKLSACVVSNDVGENNRYHAEIAERVAEHIQAAHELEGDGFSILDHYHAQPEYFAPPYRACPMLEYLTVIGADCTIYTCQDKAYTQSGTLGSIAGRRFRDVWASPEVRDVVRGWDASHTCRHHCVSHGKNLLLTEARSLDPEHAVFV